uniref:uncharacterized protein LOC122608035 n=1 Tax=Erigeron canadensis TaxID=72917 RepID=UPI001CB92C4B|nr:uncharacterized protein LOC122608035 [Erigeron canadensis]
MYYPGVVQFFDNINKRHKVLYDDGDEELLDLKWENWELVENACPMLDYGEQTPRGRVKRGSHGEAHFACENGRRKKVSSSKFSEICVMGLEAFSSPHQSHSEKQRSHGHINLACGNGRRRKISSSQSPESRVMGLKSPCSLHESHSQNRRSLKPIHLTLGNGRRRKVSSSQSPEICILGLKASSPLHESTKAREPFKYSLQKRKANTV